jgi:hypothetical protein
MTSIPSSHIPARCDRHYSPVSKAFQARRKKTTWPQVLLHIEECGLSDEQELS